jgi:hypothetical protein
LRTLHQLAPRAAVLLAFALACSGDEGASPSPSIEEIFLSVTTQEAEEARRLMLTGEVGFAHVIAFRSSVGADPGEVSFSSSDPGVIAVRPTTRRDAELTAVSPGSVQIVASSQGLEDRVRVDVFDVPPPIDDLQVRLALISSEATAVYDAEGQLASIQLAVGESAALDMRVVRDGALVTRIPFLLVSQQLGTVRVDEHCRPVELDPQCDVFGTWGWATGLEPGQSAVTVTVRNRAVTFVVSVG